MAEGKTLIPQSTCSLCDVDQAIKFCVDCRNELCLRCSTAHGKLEALRHHKLIPIEEKPTVDTSSNTTDSQTFCSVHTSKSLSIICETCLSAICGTCADTEHKPHRLIRTNLDITMLQRISAQKAPKFMEILHKLDKQPDGSKMKLELYKTARDMIKTWKGELWRVIEQDSDNLLDQIEREIKKQEVLLADIQSNMKVALENTDKQMSVLSNARRINNKATLLSNIHEGDNILQKAQLLLTEMENTRQKFTIDDILPFQHELKNVEQNLHTFFTVTLLEDKTPPGKLMNPSKHTKPRDYSLLSKLDSHHIEKITTGRYRLSETCKNNTEEAIVYHASKRDIYIFNIRSKQKKKFTCTKNIARMATLSSKQHVIIEDGKSEFHILNEYFDIVKSSGNILEYKSSGIYPISKDTFVLSERRESYTRPGSRFRKVTVSSSNKINSIKIMCEVDFEDWNGILSLHSNKYLTLIPTRYVTNVDLTTQQYTVFDMKSQVGQGHDFFIYALCVDEDNRLLIGDSKGRIYLATPTKYERELPNFEEQGVVGGIAIRGNKVVIVAGENISIYE